MTQGRYHCQLYQPFLSLIDSILPLHLHTSVPEVVLTVKSWPDSEKAFSFMCRVTCSGWHCDSVGPRGGSKAVRGAILICLQWVEEVAMVRGNCLGVRRGEKSPTFACFDWRPRSILQSEEICPRSIREHSLYSHPSPYQMVVSFLSIR